MDLLSQKAFGAVLGGEHSQDVSQRSLVCHYLAPGDPSRHALSASKARCHLLRLNHQEHHPGGTYAPPGGASAPPKGGPIVSVSPDYFPLCHFPDLLFSFSFFFISYFLYFRKFSIILFLPVLTFSFALLIYVSRFFTSPLLLSFPSFHSTLSFSLSPFILLPCFFPLLFFTHLYILLHTFPFKYISSPSTSSILCSSPLVISTTPLPLFFTSCSLWLLPQYFSRLPHHGTL